MRQIFFHVGTHKTGTTALQGFLAFNSPVFAQAGIHIAQSGRARLNGEQLSLGNHQLAWDLTAGGTYGALRDLLTEIGAVSAPAVVLSSEEFHPLYTRPQVLRDVSAALSSIGWTAKAVVYLRAQISYAESLYCEFTKRAFVTPLRSFVDEIIQTGSFTETNSKSTIAFDYETLLGPWSDAFGAGNVIVRQYDQDAAAGALFQDFCSIIDADRRIAAGDYRNLTPVINRSPSLFDILLALHTASVLQGRSKPLNDETFAFLRGLPAVPAMHELHRRFNVLTESDRVRVLRRFSECNRRTNATFGTALPDIERGDCAESPQDQEITRRQHAIVGLALSAWGYQPDVSSDGSNVSDAVTTALRCGHQVSLMRQLEELKALRNDLMKSER